MRARAGCVFVALLLGLVPGCRGKTAPNESPSPPPPRSDAATAAAKVVSVVAGREHSCALLDEGRVRCWGNGEYGRLGVGSRENVGDDETAASAKNVDIGEDAIALAAGGEHTCALLKTGKVRCWGRAEHGQLGYGNRQDIGDNESPASAGDVPLGGRVVALAAGYQHTCALLEDGAVRCWGANDEGELGTDEGGDIGDDETPGTVPALDLGERVTAIAAGGGGSCALLASGAVRCWGAMRGATSDRYSSAAEYANVDLGASAVRIFSGATALSFCALSAAGDVRCWGDLPQSSLPDDGTKANRDPNQIAIHRGNKFGFPTPSQIGNLPTRPAVTQVSLASDFGCYLAGGHAYCWGNGEHGMLGSTQPSSLLKDAVKVETGNSVVELAVGAMHACALLDNARVKCWGWGAKGQLGYGSKNSVGDKEPLSGVGYSL